MVITDNFPIAFKSLFRNKLRSFLTMLGIIIGVASVILLVSIGAGLQRYITEQFEALGSNLIFVAPGEVEFGSGPPGMRQTLSSRDVRVLRHIGYPIQEASGYIEVHGKAKYRTKETTIQVGGIEGEGVKMLNLHAKQGVALSTSDVSKSLRVAFIGPEIAKDLFGEEYPIGKSILVLSGKYKIIGVFESKGGGGFGGTSIDETIFVPLTTAQKQFNQDKLTMIYVSVAGKETIPEAKKKIEEVFLKSHDKEDFSVLGQEDLLQTVNQILGVLTAGLGGIAAISLLVGGIGIMNIMFVSVTERTKEIGLRKALGATPKDVLAQFLVEAVTLSLVGGSIGILLAIGGSLIISQFFKSDVTPFAIILAFSFSSAIGVIFGVAPAWKAAKMDPIEALRYE